LVCLKVAMSGAQMDFQNMSGLSRHQANLEQGQHTRNYRPAIQYVSVDNELVTQLHQQHFQMRDDYHRLSIDIVLWVRNLRAAVLRHQTSPRELQFWLLDVNSCLKRRLRIDACRANRLLRTTIVSNSSAASTRLLGSHQSECTCFHLVHC